MILNSALFIKVKSVYDTREVLKFRLLNKAMLLEKQYKGFSRNGANLNERRQREITKNRH